MEHDKSSLQGIDAEVNWGLSYRQKKKNARRQSIGPTGSPINIQRMWERYQVTKELRELEEIKHQMPIPLPKTFKLPKLSSKKIDRAGFTKKQYIDYLATPHQYHVEPAKTRDKAKELKKKLKPEKCSPRLVQLAKPTKVRVLFTWKDYQSRLPVDTIVRLEEMLRTDHTLDPKFARCCFKELDRKERQKKNKLRKKCRKELKRKKRESQKWLKMQIKSTAQLIISFLQKEPLLTLSFKQMLLSNVILTELANRGDIKCKPLRNSSSTYHQTIVDIVDQLAVWMDTIFRYVDVQYTESLDEFVRVPSLGSMLGEEEEEGEEEGEEKESEPRFSLPPLPDLPEFKPLPSFPTVPEIGEEGEAGDYGTVFEVTAGPSEPSIQEGGEDDGGLILEPIEDGAGGGEDEDMLNVLLAILSASPNDVLQQQVDPDTLPDITYQDLLERLTRMHDQEQLNRKRERQAILEQTLISWARNNDPDRVNERLMRKIQDAAGILSECLRKESGMGLARSDVPSEGLEWTGVGSGEESTTAGAFTSETESAPSLSDATDGGQAEDQIRPLDTLPEEETFGTEDEVSEIRSENQAIEDAIMDVGEAPAPSTISGWVIHPDESQTRLPTIGEGADIESAGGVSMDMTGELRVVKDEEIEPGVSEVMISERISVDVGVPSISAELQEREIMGIRGDIPTLIAGHKPSKVFEHMPDTICCLTLKVWATWLLEVANNAHAWSQWLNDIINEIRRIASVIRGEVKDSQGQPIMFYKEDWVQFSEKVERMIVSWRQYSMHVRDLTDRIVPNFQGKRVICCPKCLQDNLIVDVAVAHDISQQLAEAMNTTSYWRRWLDDIIAETRRLTHETMPTVTSDTTSRGTMEIIELRIPRPVESEESLYEIEEITSSSHHDI